MRELIANDFLLDERWFFPRRCDAESFVVVSWLAFNFHRRREFIISTFSSTWQFSGRLTAFCGSANRLSLASVVVAGRELCTFRRFLSLFFSFFSFFSSLFICNAQYCHWLLWSCPQFVVLLRILTCPRDFLSSVSSICLLCSVFLSLSFCLCLSRSLRRESFVEFDLVVLPSLFGFYSIRILIAVFNTVLLTHFGFHARHARTVYK